MSAFELKIVTPEKVVYSDKVSQVSVSTTTGQITILPHHVPLVTELAPGEILVRKDGQSEDLMAVSGGFVEVLPDQVVVLADTAERAADIDEQRAEEARQRAQQALESKTLDREQFAYFAAQMEKELARLRVVRKHRGKGGVLEK